MDQLDASSGAESEPLVLRVASPFSQSRPRPAVGNGESLPFADVGSQKSENRSEVRIFLAADSHTLHFGQTLAHSLLAATIRLFRRFL